MQKIAIIIYKMDLVDQYNDSKIKENFKSQRILNCLKVRYPSLLISQHSDQFSIKMVGFAFKINFLDVMMEVKIDFRARFLSYNFEAIYEYEPLVNKINFFAACLQKHILQSNSRLFNLFHFSWNPKIGSVRLNFSTCLPEFIGILCLTELICNVFDNNLEQISREFLTIHKIVNSCRIMIQECPYKSEDVRYLKEYVLSAPYYRWQSLNSFQTQNKSQSIDYQYLKRKYIEMDKYSPDRPIFNVLMKISSAPLKNFSFKHRRPLSALQDQELKQNYLSKFSKIFEKSKQVERVQIQEQEISKIHRNAREVAMSMYFEDPKSKNNFTINKKILVRVNKINQSYDHDHQIKILNQAHPNEFRGIAKYYCNLNSNASEKKYVFTNLYKSKLIANFIKSNRETMTLTTKLYFLTQIALALKYLRDNQITYNNLAPENLYIKKGSVKLFNFTKSQKLTNEQANGQQKQIRKIGVNEKIDVQAFGRILYYILQNKPIKQHTSSRIYSNRLRPRAKPVLYALEKCQNQQFLRLLLYFSLNCILGPSVKEQTQKFKELQFKYNKVPYLDWVLIITQYVQQKFANPIY